METHAFDRISNDIANFHVRYGDKISCLIVRDMNSRTGESKDYVENDNTGYVPVPDDYIENDDVPHITSCGKKVPDEYGHKLIDLCKTYMSLFTSILKYMCYTWYTVKTIQIQFYIVL